jgi:hypothetical protein
MTDYNSGMAKKNPTTVDPLSAQLDRAKKSDRYMVAVWYREGDELHLYRTTNNFLHSDLGIATNLLHQDLDKERQNLTKEEQQPLEG